MRDKIKEILADRGWSIYRLSKESKVPGATLHDFLVTEKIKYLGVDKLEKITRALGISIEDLLNEERNIEEIKNDQYRFISDENIKRIVMAAEFMTKEQKQELRAFAERLYADAFERI